MYNMLPKKIFRAFEALAYIRSRYPDIVPDSEVAFALNDRERSLAPILRQLNGIALSRRRGRDGGSQLNPDNLDDSTLTDILYALQVSPAVTHKSCLSLLESRRLGKIIIDRSISIWDCLDAYKGIYGEQGSRREPPTHPIRQAARTPDSPTTVGRYFDDD